MNARTLPARGFNAIEMLIVLAMISLLAAVSLPSYRQYLLTARLAQAIDVAAGIQLLIENDSLEPGIAQADLSSTTGGLYEGHDVLTASGPLSSVSIANGTITLVGNSSELYNYAITLTFTPTFTNGRITSWRCTTTSDVIDVVPKLCQNL